MSWRCTPKSNCIRKCAIHPESGGQRCSDARLLFARHRAQQCDRSQRIYREQPRPTSPGSEPQVRGLTSSTARQVRPRYSSGALLQRVLSSTALTHCRNMVDAPCGARVESILGDEVSRKEKLIVSAIFSSFHRCCPAPIVRSWIARIDRATGRQTTPMSSLLQDVLFRRRMLLPSRHRLGREATGPVTGRR